MEGAAGLGGKISHSQHAILRRLRAEQQSVMHELASTQLSNEILQKRNGSLKEDNARLRLDSGIERATDYEE